MLHTDGFPRDWNNADVKLAFTPPENESYSYDLWAPELHDINGLWYIIFTGDVDPDQPSPEQDMYCKSPLSSCAFERAPVTIPVPTPVELDTR